MIMVFRQTKRGYQVHEVPQTITPGDFGFYFTVIDSWVVVNTFLFLIYLMEMISVPFFFGVIMPFLDIRAMPFPEEVIVTLPDSKIGSVLIFIFRPVDASSSKFVKLSQ